MTSSNPPQAGRYALEHLVSGSRGVMLWRAEDPALGRPVAITVIELSDERAPLLAAAAREAAALQSRALVRILDVVETADNLMIVCEWINGRTLADTFEARDGEALTPAAATTLARRIASAMADVHAEGGSHGRLRPSSVLITDDDDVRLRGVGVDAALWGQAGDPLRADIEGVGALLYAGLTARWPYGMADGVAAAPRSGDGVLLPSQVTADIPVALDMLVARSVAGVNPVRGAVRFTSMREFADALRVTEGQFDPRRSPRVVAPRSRRKARRVMTRAVAVAAGVLLVAGAGIAGAVTMTNATSPWGTAARASGSDIFTATASPSPLAISGTDAPAGTFVPVSVSAFDPFQLEEGSKANPRLAVDGNDTSAWTTRSYWSSDLEGNRGTGLVLDLGSSRAVSVLSLKLVGNGTSIQVRVSPTMIKDPAKWTELARANGASTEIDLRAPRPVVGQYVLLWFTDLPLDASGEYVGGVREAVVRG